MAIRVVSIISRMNVGGPAVLLSELIKNLPMEEFEHTLITGTCQENEIDYLDSHPLDSEVIYIDEIKRSVLPFNDIKSFFKLIRVLRTLRPDIVHTHTSKAGVLGRLAARVAAPNAKIIHTFHGHLLYGYFSSVKTQFFVIIERLLGMITDVAVAINVSVMQDLSAKKICSRSEWRIIHPAVPIMDSNIRKVESKSTVNLIWVGRFAEVKDPLFAIEVFRELQHIVNQPITFLMIGDGTLLPDAKALAHESELKITFTGWTDDVYLYLAASDLLIMTSRNEGLGMVILEAAQLTIPTVAIDVGGIKDFIDDGNTGYFAPRDPKLFADKIKSIVAEPFDLMRVGKNAMDKVYENFSYEKFISNHIALYREVSRG